ncbi:MAG: GntR family transcriptional regulator, partial [Victivallales bacterium]|nr:GntR family transcriptional regulator [Victivallales bacterium]
MKIDKTNGLPKFFQLKKLILDDIAIGHYPIDSKLPTERAMMKMYGVSSITVARAMKELVEEGIVRRRIGDGSYVAEIPSRSAPLTAPQSRIVFCSARKEISPTWDPCNWFVENEIRRGFLDACTHDVDFADFAELEGLLEKNAEQAVVLINPTTEILIKTRDSRIDHVIVDQAGVLKPDLSIVKGNSLTGVYDLISHLINVENHRHVALIAGASAAHNDRITGYEVALKACGLAFDDALVVKTENGSDLGGYRAMKELLNLPERPTAVFIDTDLKAAGALKAVEDAGLKVPDDVSIAGFDDMPGSD